ncbi:MreB/Mrl family cell shape determining protein [candidate division KSB3 bacterium]|uniref:Cell shape-determining protein MreB n=1 Tax=candidate division KSB3 bacterium TaxID=2044937 RepID=A0A9D5JXT5_9BACT|nr:MreB/Mrl family cell shape determining protein [candidate division KSB3 bacterium]MBD3325807.1 MreB/Mrl family cell shape determining protein [candidate division KSB3 bacterium]
MFNVFKWFSKDLAIDLGTANTLVYVRGKGIVVNEPSVVATDTRTGKILAIGQEAKAMVGMTPDQITAIRPMKDGVIADFRMTEILLRHFIKKVSNRNYLVRPRIVIAVPFGITEVEKKAVKDSAYQAGASEVTLILEPMAAAIGAGLPIQEPSGNMIVDIGGGTTEVAVISLAGIVFSRSIRIAGDEMDEAIIQYIKRKYNLLIGLKTAELIKKTLGSAYPLDSEKVVEVRGRDLAGGVPNVMKISSEEIRDALAETVFAIVDAIRVTLEKTPPELSADIIDRGIILTGGSALLQNLDYKIKEETGLPVALADDPLTTVAVGTGKLLIEPELLRKVAVD